MKPGLFEQLETRINSLTTAERQIANYILANKSSIPFETAASLAQKLDISAVTVGRFCRLLGFRHFKDLKEDLRKEPGHAPWLVGDQFATFREKHADKKELRRSLELEIASLVEVYQAVDTKAWRNAVALLARVELVQVAGFQTERGLAQLLAHSLQYIRDGVELTDTSAGHYADIFARRVKKRCLVLIDIKRYSRQSYLLAEQAAAVSLPLIIITDKHCDWSRRFTPHVLAVPTDSGQFWGSSVAMTCMINLLVNAVVASSGAAVEKRLEQISTLFEQFTGFTGPAGKRGPQR